MPYAQGTSVPIDRSRSEIERIIVRYGAAKYGTWSEPGKAIVQFETKNGRQVQIPVPMPSDKDVPRGTRDRAKWIDGEMRRRWRVLVITLKAMLEAVESKLFTFDQVFLSHMVIPGTAETLGSKLIPRLPALYSGTSLPALLMDTAQSPDAPKEDDARARGEK